MSLKQEAQLAETIERQRLLLTFFIFIVGVAQAVQVLQFYYSRQHYPVVNFMHNAVLLTQLGAFVVLLAGSFQIFRRSRGMPSMACRRMLADGFVEKTNLTAFMFSWLLTFAMILLLGEWSEPDVMFYGPHDPASQFPATYYLNLVAACLTLSYSVAFFVLIQRGDEIETSVTA